MGKGYMEIFNLNNTTVHFMLDVEEALTKLYEAIKRKDAKVFDFIIENDAKFNAKRNETENKCLSMFLREQHYSRDLRNILSVFKITAEVERIGDQIRDIAENIKGDKMDSCDAILNSFMKMLDNVRAMFSMCIKCFASFDSTIAAEIIAYDDTIDSAYHRLKADIIKELDITHNNELFDLLSAVKHTEKIGDHVSNIAEWVHYIVTSERK